MSLHVIIGSGAVGSGTARQLADAGHDVRIITRSGSGPDHPQIEKVAADAADQVGLTGLCGGASTVYNCANPPYHAWTTAWPPLAASILGAAEATSARLVTMSNLYGYAPGTSPMKAGDPLRPPSTKGAARVKMWEAALGAHEAGRVQVTEARASDYFGPGLGASAHFGDRVVPRIIAGKTIRVMGNPDAPHSWTYIGDVCATLAVLGTDDRALGRAWHVPTGPPLSARELAAQLSRVAGSEAATIKTVPRLAIRAAGLFSPMMRELPEMLYQFDDPFIIDSADTETMFGLGPTPLADQLQATIASYRAETPGLAAGAVS